MPIKFTQHLVKIADLWFYVSMFLSHPGQNLRFQPRFHATSVVWNLALTWEIPKLPILGGMKHRLKESGGREGGNVWVSVCIHVLWSCRVDLYPGLKHFLSGIISPHHHLPGFISLIPRTCLLLYHGFYMRIKPPNTDQQQGLESGLKQQVFT